MAKISVLEENIVKHERFSEWISLPDYRLNLYYRITQRIIEGKVCKTFDLSNIAVNEKFRNKGYFKAFLIELEEIANAHKIAIFVENILNDDLYQFLWKRGYLTDYTGICLYRNYTV